MNELDKTTHFKTPEGYFENFSGRLMGKITRDDTGLPENPGFKVPEGYFEGLQQQIQLKLGKEEAKIVQLHPLKKYYLFAASIAAILIVVFGINWNGTAEITFDHLANSDIERYFDYNDLDLSTLEITEVFPVDELSIGDILNKQLNEENLVDYLNNNIDNIEELNLENDE